LNEDYSFEFWFNPATDLTEWRRFIYKNGQIDVSYIGGNRIRVQISGYATVDSVSAIQRGTWNHIVVTFANGPMGDDAIRLM
jgi:predicted transcriptional regulator